MSDPDDEVLREAAAHACIQAVEEVSRGLARHGVEWQRVCERATRGEIGFWARLRCLLMNVRYRSLCRAVERQRLRIMAAESRAVAALESCSIEKAVFRKFLGVGSLPTSLGSSGRGSLSPKVVRLQRWLQLDLEERLESVLRSRLQIATAQLKARSRARAERFGFFREANELLKIRPDVFVLLREQYELKHADWPSAATERLILLSAADGCAGLRQQRDEILQKNAVLKREIGLIRQKLLSRLARVSRYVALESRSERPIDPVAPLFLAQSRNKSSRMTG
jgi:hypothetical protein